MTGETRAFFESFLLGDRNVLEMLDTPDAFLDTRMARHYGVTGIESSEFVETRMPAQSHRKGLLTHASLLTMTSTASRTSPVKRGEWVLSQLLCAPPPPPPPGVPALPEVVSTGTMRQRLEEHRKAPACASCHDLMDPIGFAFEHYDALGRWRELDAGLPIDASGTWPDRTRFDGVDELAAIVKKDPRFVQCLTRKLFAFAVGRAPGPRDGPALDHLEKRFAQGRYRAVELVLDLIRSDDFFTKRGERENGP